MSPEDWARIPWYTRQRLQERARRVARSESVGEQARRIWADMEPDADAAAHVAAIDYYTAKPRKRTA